MSWDVGRIIRRFTQPSVVTSGGADDVADRMERARKLKAAGKYRDAIAALTRVLRDFPDYAPAFYQRGYCHTCVGDWHSADEDFRRGFQLDPSHVNELGTIYRRCMMSARERVAPRKKLRPETIVEAVERKFIPEVRSEVLGVLKSIKEHPLNAVGVEQLQRVLIKLNDIDGKFITEKQFWETDARDLVVMAAAKLQRDYEGPGFADVFELA
jgi:tetratricopeptide (TPR) repeat protein